MDEVAVYAKLTKVYNNLMRRDDVVNAMVLANVMAELAADFLDRTDENLEEKAAEFASNHLTWL